MWKHRRNAFTEHSFDLLHKVSVFPQHFKTVVWLWVFFYSEIQNLPDSSLMSNSLSSGVIYVTLFPRGGTHIVCIPVCPHHVQVSEMCLHINACINVNQTSVLTSFLCLFTVLNMKKCTWFERMFEKHVYLCMLCGAVEWLNVVEKVSWLMGLFLQGLVGEPGAPGREGEKGQKVILNLRIMWALQHCKLLDTLKQLKAYIYELH